MPSLSFGRSSGGMHLLMNPAPLSQTLVSEDKALRAYSCLWFSYQCRVMPHSRGRLEYEDSSSRSKTVALTLF